MQEERGLFRPWIWRRLLLTTLLGALIPLSLMAYLTVIAPAGTITGDPQVRVQVAQETEEQLARQSQAEAARINQRLSRIGYSVKLLAAYATEVLSAPHVFASQVVPQLQDDASGETEVASEGDTDEVGASANGEPTYAPLDNPLFYTQGDDGAIRKLIDDGRPAVYFAARQGESFTVFDMQRLHASTVLDTLLIEPVETDSLCTQAFLITRDDLIRTYPFLDFSLWPPDKNLSKPRDFWTANKAGDDGLLWTNPYYSTLTERWVVACLAAVQAGDRVLAVAGCEVSLENIGDELLEFSLGSGSVSWLIKPSAGDDGTSDAWLVLAAQSGGREQLGVVPLEAAEQPTEKHTGVHILDESDLLTHGLSDMVSALRANITGGVMATNEEGRYVAVAPMEDLGWLLCGVMHSPATAAAGEFEQQLHGWQGRQLVYVLGVFVLGLVLAFLLAMFEARRITGPLGILTQQILPVPRTERISAVTIADEGEIGALASAVQELIDYAIGKGHKLDDTAPPGDDSE